MSLLKNIFELFFPRRCVGCEKELMSTEKIICTFCECQLLPTSFCKIPKNELEESFYGRIPVRSGAALFYFTKGGVVQQLIHHLKYKNRQDIGIFTAEWLAKNIKKSGRFESVDIIVPVPLQKEKLRKRGYNQVAEFGKTLTKEMKCEYNDDVLKRINTKKSQTHKNRMERWENVKNAFSNTNPSFFDNKHILLVDDVVTTGATLEACYFALSKSKNIKISIATIAFVSEQ